MNNKKEEIQEKLIPRDVEELNAKCNICGVGLSYIENLYYGNRCVICTKKPVYYVLGFFKLCIHLHYDLCIYKEFLNIRKRSEGADDARETILAALASFGFEDCGFSDINFIKTIRKKRLLLKALKGVKHWRTEEEIRAEQDAQKGE